MTDQKSTLLATAIVVFTGVAWGFYWLPVRAMSDLGLPGAWGTLLITGAAAILLAPITVIRRGAILQGDPLALAALGLGGAAFALYSIGFNYGRVAIIILLYFLTPVWSTLIGRYVMGWPVSRLRRLAILFGLAGLFVMLGAKGQIPYPRGSGEWMALVAGILWSVATTGMRTRSDLAPCPSAFVFAAGATVTTALIAPFVGPVPGDLGGSLAPFALGLVTGGLWWGLSIAGLMWATVRLEPARVGILLMSEVIVGAVTAALIAGEHLSPLELSGGALVLCAGVLEVWPEKRNDIQ